MRGPDPLHRGQRQVGAAHEDRVGRERPRRVDAKRARRLHGVEKHGTGVAAAALADHLRAGALAPVAMTQPRAAFAAPDRTLVVSDIDERALDIVQPDAAQIGKSPSQLASTFGSPVHVTTVRSVEDGAVFAEGAEPRPVASAG